MTLLRKFLRKNPATAGRPADQREAFSAQSGVTLSPGTEGPQAGQLIRQLPDKQWADVKVFETEVIANKRSVLVQRRADKKRGNCPINETRACRRVHSILAEGPNNG